MYLLVGVNNTQKNHAFKNIANKRQQNRKNCILSSLKCHKTYFRCIPQYRGFSKEFNRGTAG